MEAKEYFEKEYGKGHIESVVKLNDIVSLYGLMEEYHQYKAKSERLSDDKIVSNFIDFALKEGLENAEISKDLLDLIPKFINIPSPPNNID